MIHFFVCEGPLGPATNTARAGRKGKEAFSSRSAKGQSPKYRASQTIPGVTGAGQGCSCQQRGCLTKGLSQVGTAQQAASWDLVLEKNNVCHPQSMGSRRKRGQEARSIPPSILLSHTRVCSVHTPLHTHMHTHMHTCTHSTRNWLMWVCRLGGPGSPWQPGHRTADGVGSSPSPHLKAGGD